MANGSRTLPPKFWKQVEAIEDFVEDEKNYKSKPEESFGEVVRKRFWQGKHLDGDEKLMSDFMMNYLFCTSYGTDPEDISAKYIG